MTFAFGAIELPTDFKQELMSPKAPLTEQQREALDVFKQFPGIVVVMGKKEVAAFVGPTFAQCAEFFSKGGNSANTQQPVALAATAE